MPVFYDGEEFTFYNPDGSEIKVRGWGNQFAAVFETLDGFTIIQDPTSGFFHYAILSEDGTELLPSGTPVGTVAPQQLPMPRHLRLTREAVGRQARAAQRETGVQPRWEIRRQERQQRRARSPRSSKDTSDDTPEEGPLAATVGNYVGLCLLIQFPDVSGTISQQEVTHYCNQPGYTGFGNNGSVRDYFYDNSDRKLTYTNVVTAYYTAQHNRAYYTDPHVSYGTRARELIIEALNHLKAQGFNFEQLTADGGGYVQALNVFYAGPTVNNWSQGLWPHSWALATPYVASSTRRFSDYQITNMGSQLSLRTFCHENGHMICDFPDLYDYNNQHSGVGHYCLMCFGGSNTNPTQVCAYLKNTAGWTSSLRPIAPGMSYSVAAERNNFLIHRKNQAEYFIVENRAKSGRDAVLPDAGLAIWHVHENGSNSNPPLTPSKPLECSLEQADGRFDLENKRNGGDADDLYGAPAAPKFGNSTNPNSRWWDSSVSGLEFTSISAPESTMTVNTQVLWQNDRLVLRTHAKNGASQTWAFLQGDSAWLQIGGASTDGNTNIFMTLCEALANGRKVDVLVSNGRIIETTLK
ncbi:MAG: M6 family metalloprotease domain-containing protein [Gammaproteobacteria bacterium]